MAAARGQASNVPGPWSRQAGHVGGPGSGPRVARVGGRPRAPALRLPGAQGAEGNPGRGSESHRPSSGPRALGSTRTEDRHTRPKPSQERGDAGNTQRTSAGSPALHEPTSTSARYSQNTHSLHSGVILEKPPGCCEGHMEVPPPGCPPPGPRPTHPCAVGTAHPWRPSWRHPPSLGPGSRSLFLKMLPHQEMRNSSGRRQREQGRSTRAADSATSRLGPLASLPGRRGPPSSGKSHQGRAAGFLPQPDPGATAPSRIRTQERRGPPPA